MCVCGGSNFSNQIKMAENKNELCYAKVNEYLLNLWGGMQCTMHIKNFLIMYVYSYHSSV